METAKSLNMFNENPDLIAIRRNDIKCHLETAMSSRETINQLQQEYYNKVCGCSVRNQKDNLFDYNSWLKK